LKENVSNTNIGSDTTTQNGSNNVCGHYGANSQTRTRI